MRSTTRRSLLFGVAAAAALLISGGGRPGAPARPQPLTGSPTGSPTAPQATIAADHHLHIRSAEGAALMEHLAEVLGESAGAPTGPQEAVTAGHALEAMDAAGVARGVVISIAYMFGMPEIDIQDAYEKVRAENDYVAAEVALHPDRLIGACSVHPLADYALEEIERCAVDDRLDILKLHLANSDVDLRNPGHVERLADVFRTLGRLGMPALVHMRTRNPEYGAEDARIFLAEVLSQAPALPVQIAHMGGWGGYDDATDAALGAFADALADGRLNPALYSFDLAAVVFNPAAAGDDAALADRVMRANERLAGRIREIGLERVIYATDWPAWPPGADAAVGIRSNVALIEAALPLSDAERTRVLSNVGSVIRRP